MDHQQTIQFIGQLEEKIEWLIAKYEHSKIELANAKEEISRLQGVVDEQNEHLKNFQNQDHRPSREHWLHDCEKRCVSPHQARS